MILHRDPDLLVLDKPAGVSLLADRAGEPCLWDRLKAEYGAPLLVHRLDKGTSGVLLVALSRRAQSSLTRQFTDGTVQKFYLAHVAGIPSPSQGMVDLPLRPGRKSRFRVAGKREDIVCNRGRWHLARGDGGDPGHPSQTRYRLLRTAAGRSLLLLKPLTGRTHQIRVHLSWLGWPILGDSLYGKPDSPEQAAPRLMLHCTKMAFRAEWSGSRWQSFRSRWVAP